MFSGFKMKKIFIISLTLLVVSTPALTFAMDEEKDISIAVDALLVRPLGLVSIAIGGSIFVISLPFTAISGSIGKATNILILRPVAFTFNRPIGDFDYRADCYKE